MILHSLPPEGHKPPLVVLERAPFPHPREPCPLDRPESIPLGRESSMGSRLILPCLPIPPAARPGHGTEATNKYCQERPDLGKWKIRALDPNTALQPAGRPARLPAQGARAAKSRNPAAAAARLWSAPAERSGDDALARARPIPNAVQHTVRPRTPSLAQGTSCSRVDCSYHHTCSR